MQKYVAHVDIPEQHIEVEVLALSRDEAKRVARRDVALNDLENSIAVSEHA